MGDKSPFASDQSLKDRERRARHSKSVQESKARKKAGFRTIRIEVPINGPLIWIVSIETHDEITGAHCRTQGVCSRPGDDWIMLPNGTYWKPEVSMPLASQKSVDYSQGGDACAFCEYFVADGEDCQKVQGPITQDMWCKLFKRAQDQREDESEEQGPGENENQLPKGRLPAKHIALILIGKSKET